MTLTELRYIVAVARERHFGRAARACFVSQPTLSVAVKKLEDELGVQLFERAAGDVSVTPAGEPIIAQARQVLAEADKLKALAQSGQDPLQGELRLGAIYTVGPYLLPHVIPKLRRRAPDMPLVLEENFTARLRERLRHGELDVIIISLPFSEAGVVTWPLYDEPFTVLLPAGHRLAKKAAVSSADLTGENLLLLGSGHCFRDQVLAACPDCKPLPALEGGSLETIRQMVASGLGVTVLPLSSTLASGKARNKLLVERPFAGASPSRTIALAWRRGYARPQAIEVLRRAIMESHIRGITYRDFDMPSEPLRVAG